ncbi:sperm flagellar protein 1-like [Maniola hyperantus]|uniref:sperm flagellar protein 1-like n=1 Tax=Aphantopus hyperantus TaxID=2795564 RepID=UPI001569657A|nr:sperm flagellar protein 1-like isoform X1 [Maniola hyperantus]XP_034837417.1 sperm flagellar protein 1-like isoform X2 [Maniola hyperantus]
MSLLESPIPLSDIEDVLAWVDTFKLSRPTKKINRDFSDAVLLAEILSVHYPKLVEMHNYPPRNSHSLKLNNWMTLNRKVLKKLKLNLCCNTMEQLANCTPGLIERVLLMVKDKIRRDEEMNKTLKEVEQNMSSGGSYYEACGDDEHVLVVPVKTRVNGVLETIQKKVISHEHYLGLKEELKDAKDSSEILKQKVEHLDSLIKLKEERIEELQKQLDRKQTRRKEVESNQNSISVPFEPPTPEAISLVNVESRPLSLKSVDGNTRIGKEESKIPVPIADVIKQISKTNITEVTTIDNQEETLNNVERIKSDVFKEVEIIDQRVLEGFHDSLEYINESDTITAMDDKQNSIKDIEYSYEINYLN